MNILKPPRASLRTGPKVDHTHFHSGCNLATTSLDFVGQPNFTAGQEQQLPFQHFAGLTFAASTGFVLAIGPYIGASPAARGST